jgi:hypothetical protein
MERCLKCKPPLHAARKFFSYPTAKKEYQNRKQKHSQENRVEPVLEDKLLLNTSELICTGSQYLAGASSFLVLLINAELKTIRGFTYRDHIDPMLAFQMKECVSFYLM